MYECFLFDFQSPPLSADRRQRVSVVFSPVGAFDMQSLKGPLRGFFDQVMPPDVVLLVGTDADAQGIKHLVESEELHDYLPAFTRYSSPPAVCGLCQSADGKFAAYGQAVASNKLTEMSFIELMLREGLVEIFKRRGGVLEAGRTYHYVKPSGKHCDRFIRTGNTLIRSAEVGFVAFGALRYLTRNVPHIYTDTAAINVVAYAMVLLRKRLDPHFRAPTIDSFSSYQELEKFSFDLATESLFLISASTSCDLERELLGCQASQNRIVTLFYLGDRQENSKILCDLTKRTASASGFDVINSHPRENCPWCRQGLPIVEIIGDQFLPENPKVIPVLVRKEDSPKWLREFTREFVGRGIIRTYYAATPDVPDQRQEIFLDLAPLFDGNCQHSAASSNKENLGDSDFVKSLDRLLVQTLPASLRRIIYLDDSASQALAQRARRLFKNSLNSDQDIAVINAKEVQANLAAHKQERGTTLVVAGVVVSGRRLMAVSQSLRQIQTNRSIQYLCAVVRTQTKEQHEEVRNNLQYGEQGPADYDFHFVRRIFLADETLVRSSVWDDEVDLIKKLEARYPNDQDFLKAIRSRKQMLASALNQDERGLGENLFWRRPFDAQILKLRPNFAFWDFPYDNLSITQADVYFTIISILHALRQSEGAHPGRLEQGHHHAIISPRCFDRFNDGVVQASFLRAAKPVELDYTSDEQHSLEMQRVLDFAFTNLCNELGEASVEFLVAMALRHLRILPKHAKSTLDNLRSRISSVGDHQQKCILDRLSEFILAELIDRD